VEKKRKREKTQGRGILLVPDARRAVAREASDDQTYQEAGARRGRTAREGNKKKQKKKKEKEDKKTKK